MSAVTEHVLDPRRPDARLHAIERKWSAVQRIAECKDPVKRRILSAVAEQTRRHLEANQHRFDELFPGWRQVAAESRFRNGLPMPVGEQVVQADIATFITQIVDTVLDAYEQDILSEITTMRMMSGPSAYVLVETETQLDASDSGFYEAGSNLADGIDPDYLDCPTECSTGKRVGYENALVTVQADCKRGWSDASLSAQQDAASQYGLNLLDRLESILARELRREWQAEAIALMIANGTAGNVTWTADAPGGSAYADLDPKVWKETLFSVAWMTAAANIFGHADNRERNPNFGVGDVRTMRRLQECKSFAIDSAFGDPDSFGVEEFANFFGTAKNVGARLYRMPLGIASNTLLVGLKRDDKPGQLQLPYVDAFAIERLHDPETACSKVGMQSRHGRHTSRGGYFSTITITPEA